MSGPSLPDRVVSRLLRPIVRLLDAQGKQLARQEKRARVLDEHLAGLREQNEALVKDVQALRRELETLSRATDDVRHSIGRRGLSGQARRIGLDVRALLRRALLDPTRLPYPQRLFAYRANVTSPNEEDGILLALIAEVASADPRFVDIGSGMSGGVAAMLAQECGWSGLMVDGNEQHVQLARPRFPGGRIAVVHCFVTRDNINSLIESHGLAGDIDFFCLDIDGNDYWIWEALTACSPRIVAVEYNAFFGLERALTVPYDATFDRADLPALVKKHYFGASLPAFVRLGRRTGYRLVTTDAAGLNAFFLRHDVAPNIPECPIDELPFRETDLGKYEDVVAVLARYDLPLVEVESPR